MFTSATAMLLLLQGGYRGVPSAADSLPISVGTATSGRTTSAGDTSSSSEVGCSRHLVHVVDGPMMSHDLFSRGKG